MAYILRGLFRFHKYINPEDYTTYEEFARSGKYATLTAGGTIGAGLGQDAAYNRRIIYKKTGLSNWIANRFSHGITTSLPVRSKSGSSMAAGGKYGTTGTNTMVIRTAKGKWPKKRKLEKAAARLRYINDATGDVQSLLLKICSDTPSAAATSDISKGSAFMLFCGQGGGINNDKDIGRMFAQSTNTAVAGFVAASRSKSLNIYIRSCHLTISISATASSAVLVEMYECICNRSHDATEVDYTSTDTLQDSFIARMPPPTVAGTALTKTHYCNNPYYWHEFGMYWKIVKVTKFVVQAGQEISFSKMINLNRIIDADRLVGVDYIKGLSRMFWFVTKAPYVGTGSSAGTWQAGINVHALYKFTNRNAEIPNFSTSGAVVT